MSALRQERKSWINEESQLGSRPHPILTFNPVYFEGKNWYPFFGDRNTLLILRRSLPKKVSFARAYCGYRAGGCKEERELGQGRAFLRWLQRHHLSIEWKATDFELHELFLSPHAPQHDPNDEMARDLSFAIAPVEVNGRKVKLYVQDDHMLSLLNFPYGDEEDFIALVIKYVEARQSWEKWRAPAPYFLDWVMSQGKRPVFQSGQIGFRLPLTAQL